MTRSYTVDDLKPWERTTIHDGRTAPPPWTPAGTPGRPEPGGSPPGRAVRRATWASKAVAAGALAWLVLGTEGVQARFDGALAAAWQVLGDRLAEREVASIARQLDDRRAAVTRVERLRDDLAARLLMTESGRDGEGSDAVDAAASDLRDALARADRALAQARAELRDRERDLMALRASAEVHRLDRELDDTPREVEAWSPRVARARRLLGAGRTDAARR